jgi:molybdate transport system substrate-binding protein
MLCAALAIACLAEAPEARRRTEAPEAQSRAPRVAAASDLKFALDEAAAVFTRERGVTVDITYSSSGTLTRQLVDGAPFDLFLSADEAYVDQLAAAGVARDRGVLYAIGRLVAFAPNGSPLKADATLDGLKALLDERRVTRFAIANPEHAPYGRAAEAALRKRNLWAPLQPFLVLGETVSQAAQFATTGDAVGGLIAYSLVLAPALKDKGTFALVPAEDHPPLRQRMALMKRAGAVAEQFYAYLQTPAAREILRKYGFTNEM